MLQRIKLNIEALKFGFKYGKDLRLRRPFMPTSQMVTTTQLAWCKHLIDTNRGHHVPLQLQHTVSKYKHVLQINDCHCGGIGRRPGLK